LNGTIFNDSPDLSGQNFIQLLSAVDHDTISMIKFDITKFDSSKDLTLRLVNSDTLTPLIWVYTLSYGLYDWTNSTLTWNNWFAFDPPLSSYKGTFTPSTGLDGAEYITISNWASQITPNNDITIYVFCGTVSHNFYAIGDGATKEPELTQDG
jgi:hypothetical protein